MLKNVRNCISIVFYKPSHFFQVIRYHFGRYYTKQILCFTMESSTIFPFTSLPLPIQFECIHGTGKAGWKIWRCVNSQYRDYADKFVFTIFVPLDVERIGGCTMHSSGYLTRMRIILAYYKKRNSLCQNKTYLKAT